MRRIAGLGLTRKHARQQDAEKRIRQGRLPSERFAPDRSHDLQRRLTCLGPKRLAELGEEPEPARRANAPGGEAQPARRQKQQSEPTEERSQAGAALRVRPPPRSRGA